MLFVIFVNSVLVVLEEKLKICKLKFRQTDRETGGDV